MGTGRRSHTSVDGVVLPSRRWTSRWYGEESRRESGNSADATSHSQDARPGRRHAYGVPSDLERTNLVWEDLDVIVAVGKEQFPSWIVDATDRSNGVLVGVDFRRCVRTPAALEVGDIEALRDPERVDAALGDAELRNFASEV